LKDRLIHAFSGLFRIELTVQIGVAAAMDVAYSRPRSKRPPGEDIGNTHKRLQYPQPPSAGPGETVFRILCPEDKAGGVIGKGGGIVSQIRQETGARITVQETVQGCEERVIVISAPEDNGNNGGDLGKISAAQEALFRVHGRIFEDIADENDPNNLITTRLVVPNGQVGCLLGKGGKIIQQMREETKAHIRILSQEKTPPCVPSTDAILEVHYTPLIFSCSNPHAFPSFVSYVFVFSLFSFERISFCLVSWLVTILPKLPVTYTRLELMTFAWADHGNNGTVVDVLSNHRPDQFINTSFGIHANFPLLLEF
jgi:predicted RNA-binding protein YlqC (UPF0109 family)